MVERRLSLLPAGVTGVTGSFVAGDPVEVIDGRGVVVARGIVSFDSDELPALIGRRTSDIAQELGAGFDREVIHRDDIVVIGDSAGKAVER